MPKSTDYSCLGVMSLFIERSDRLGPEARFLLRILTDRPDWTLRDMPTDTAEDMTRLKATIDELVGYLEWVWHSVDLTAAPSDAMAALIEKLEGYQLVIGKCIAESGQGQIQLL